MIGIRQADGSFYEIMDDAQAGHKRLILSAARTDQHGVKIDLYRSVDGTVDPAHSLGSIVLEDAHGLGYQDISFRLDLGDDDQLNATAALPGQPPKTLSVDLTPFREGMRTDSQILSDESMGSDLDTLDIPDEPMTIDLPGLDDLGDLDDLKDEPVTRSDADILGDVTLDSAELDTLDDFSFEEDASMAPELEPEIEPEPDATDAFDLGDLDAGFSDEPEPEPLPEENPAEQWEKISLDDLEPMEFMDTGDEISAPKRATPSKAPVADLETLGDDFSLDDDQSLELGDLDSLSTDFDDLPSLDSSGDDLDHDFLPPPALTEPSVWRDEPEPVPMGKPAKEAKPTKTPKPTNEPDTPSDGSSVDKTALILSLVAVSLLVLLILVLLFLNMIKAPQPPVIQPEVMRWKPAVGLTTSEKPQPPTIDLTSPHPPAFEASSVLEIPEPLKAARVSLVLSPGDTEGDAERRFGPPVAVQGNRLSW